MKGIDSIVLVLLTLFLVVGEGYFLSLEKLYEKIMVAGRRRCDDIKKAVSGIRELGLFYATGSSSGRWASWQVIQELAELGLLEERANVTLRRIETERDQYALSVMPRFYRHFKIASLVVVLFVVLLAVVISIYCRSHSPHLHGTKYRLVENPLEQLPIYASAIVALGVLIYFNTIIFQALNRLWRRITIPVKSIENELNRIRSNRRFHFGDFS